jgi:hypothetical protein
MRVVEDMQKDFAGPERGAFEFAQVFRGTSFLPIERVQQDLQLVLGQPDRLNAIIGTTHPDPHPW